MSATDAQTADDDLCLQVADGHKWTFIIAALTKRTLQIPDIKAAERLDLLERLNKLTDSYFTASMLAGILPMCDTGYAIFREARSLDPPQDETHCAASFNVLATPSVFRHFVQLNPSIDRHRRRPIRRDAAPFKRPAVATPLASSAGSNKSHGRQFTGLDL
jgi:hypothetical protein